MQNPKTRMLLATGRTDETQSRHKSSPGQRRDYRTFDMAMLVKKADGTPKNLGPTLSHRSGGLAGKPSTDVQGINGKKESRD
ncbi:MAG: hypothetical protein QXS68_06295 [Candidatus Methanomethylicaceae archaeon]